MKSPYSIIRKLLVTEKNNLAMEQDNCYTFQVDPFANKLEIKRAIEEIYKVTVLRVNTMNRKGKLRRERTMKYGQTSATKRAMVTLKADDKIEVV